VIKLHAARQARALGRSEIMPGQMSGLEYHITHADELRLAALTDPTISYSAGVWSPRSSHLRRQFWR
jgi:hypothetical protein